MKNRPVGLSSLQMLIIDPNEGQGPGSGGRVHAADAGPRGAPEKTRRDVMLSRRRSLGGRQGAYLTIVGRTAVRPDSVQVLGGMLSKRLPTSVIGVALHRFAFPSGAVPVRG